MKAMRPERKWAVELVQYGRGGGDERRTIKARGLDYGEAHNKADDVRAEYERKNPEATWASDFRVNVTIDYSEYPKKLFSNHPYGRAVLPAVCYGTNAQGSTFWRPATYEMSNFMREERPGKRARFHYIAGMSGAAIRQHFDLPPLCAECYNFVTAEKPLCDECVARKARGEA